MSPSYDYQAFGLHVRSDLVFPELMPCLNPMGEADLVVQAGKVPDDGLPGAKQLGPFLYADDKQFWLSVPGVCRYLVRNGNEIIYDPLAGTDEDSIRVFLLGSCMGALLFQRGFLVLHGNAIQVEDECVVCVGRSGAGKSSLAAAFTLRGYKILSDDVCAVNHEGMMVPGFPRIKLWQDIADHLGIDTSGLRRIRPGMEKFDYPLGEKFCLNPLAIRHVYILNEHNENNFVYESIHGIERFRPIRNNTYRVRYMEGMALKAEHLKLAGKLASQIHLTRIIRPRNGILLDELVEYILADIENKRSCG